MLNKKYDTNAYSYRIKKIQIEDNVSIGANVLILPGVTIHSNVIVGAGCVVSKDVKEGTIVAGNPMREIGKFEDFANKRRNEDSY